MFISKLNYIVWQEGSVLVYSILVIDSRTGSCCVLAISTTRCVWWRQGGKQRSGKSVEDGGNVAVWVMWELWRNVAGRLVEITWQTVGRGREWCRRVCVVRLTCKQHAADLTDAEEDRVRRTSSALPVKRSVKEPVTPAGRSTSLGTVIQLFAPKWSVN